MGYNTRQMAVLKSIELSQGVKTEEKDSDKGTPKTIIKGLESEKLTTEYNAGFVVGIDPRGEFEMLKKYAGMQDIFL